MTALLAPLAALAAAGAFVLPGPRGRALAVLAALVLAPAVVGVELLSPERLDALVGAPAIAGGLLGLALAGALATLLVRRPELLPVLVAAALPLRIPLDAGGRAVNLLLPLYVVVGAGGVAYAAARLRRGDRPLGARERGQAAEQVAPGHRGARLQHALVLATALYALQSTYSIDPHEAVRNVAFFYVPFLVLLRLLTEVEWSGRVVAGCLGVTVSVALVFALVGFYQYATGELFLNRKVMAANEFESFFRVNSLFFDPNIYGRYLAVAMIAACAVLLWGRARDSRLAALALAVLWAGLLPSFSQSSYAALLLGLAILGALRFGLRPVALSAAAVVLATLAVLLAAPALAGEELASGRALDRAASGRIELMAGGVDMFLERPVLGFGAGSFAERYRVREGVGSARAEAASHTIPITVAAEQGVIGLIAYLLVLAAAFAALFAGLGGPRGREPPPAALPARAAVAAAFAALVLHTLVYAAFLEDPTAWALMGAGVGLRAAGARVASVRARTASRRQ